MSDSALSQDGLVAKAEIETDLHGHRVSSNIHFFVWNDIVLRDFSRPTWLRVASYVVTFADYLLSGTFFRMTAQAWRFSLYFLYPAMMLLLFSSLAGGIALGIGRSGLPAAGWLGFALGVLVLYGLLRYSGRRWFVLHLMDLWTFSRNHLRGKRTDAEAHIARFAQAVVAQAQTGQDDEIVLVGHSTGGALILEIAAAALALDPHLGQRGPRINVLTVGSTALKIGLHPAARAFRARVQTLVDAPAIQWIECQAQTDIVNFYRTHPAAAMGLHVPGDECKPQVHLVRVRDMLQAEVYKRFKYNIFRVHYQFIMANTQRYAYDFFMMCCGERFLSDMLGDSLRYRGGSQHSSTAPAAGRCGCGLTNATTRAARQSHSQLTGSLEGSTR